jgi:very-short-patch-repair endonuclease
MLKEKDESKWRENLLRASRLGFKKIFSPTGNTSLEDRLYKQLELENIKYIPQYVLDYKIFDAYLPDYNLVIEIDGIFWHPKSLDECKYEFQKTSYFNDLEKENLLKQKGIKLVRIRENQFPESIIYLYNVWQHQPQNNILNKIQRLRSSGHKAEKMLVYTVQIIYRVDIILDEISIYWVQ